MLIALGDFITKTPCKTDGKKNAKKKAKRRHKAADDKRKEKWYHGTIQNCRMKPTGRSREPKAPAAAAG